MALINLYMCWQKLIVGLLLLFSGSLINSLRLRHDLVGPPGSASWSFLEKYATRRSISRDNGMALFAQASSDSDVHISATGEQKRMSNAIKGSSKVVLPEGHRHQEVVKLPLHYQDYIAGVCLSEDTIQQRIRQLVEELAQQYEGQEVHVLCVLKGASVFFQDWLKVWMHAQEGKFYNNPSKQVWLTGFCACFE